MAAYYLIHDSRRFEQELQPILAECWRLRSFEPCREFCRNLLPSVETFDAEYHINEGEPLVKRVVEGLGFERDFWRALVGELLFYAAQEVPEIQTCPETLCCLLAPQHYQRLERDRDRLALIQQAHLGSRDLTFGAAVYRPEQCGFNDVADVRRLADYLRYVDPSLWKPDDLAPLAGLKEDEREEELEIARAFFAPLCEMYQQAAAAEQVIVAEIL